MHDNSSSRPSKDGKVRNDERLALIKQTKKKKKLEQVFHFNTTTDIRTISFVRTAMDFLFGFAGIFIVKYSLK
jgi:hypothetical protein